MAKKPTVKPTARRASSTSRCPVPTQPDAITIRGSAEWREWLEAFAAKMRSRPTAIIDLGLAKLAAQEGFTEPLRGSLSEGSRRRSKEVSTAKGDSR